MVSLTPEEKENGWTEEKLEKYMLDREKAQAGVILFNPDFRKPQRPRFANNRYNPLRW